MNKAGYRLIKKRCVKCREEILVRQKYNTHYSSWEDIEPWICKECMRRSNHDREWVD